MTEITVTTSSFQGGGRRWLLFEAHGNPGPVPTTSGVIDFTAFTSGTHYPNGYIASGTVVALNTSTQRLVPYVAAGANGTGTPLGHLYNDTAVPSDTSRKVVVAVIGAFARVSTGKLPANHGLDAGAKTALKLVDYVA